MDEFFKKGFQVASLLHGLFFLGLFLIFVVGYTFRKADLPHVFQLETVPGTEAKLSAVKADPVAAVIKPPTIPIETKAVVAKTAQQTKVSYEEFLKKQGTVSKPKEPKAIVAQSISVPKIQASDIRKNMEKRLASIETGNIVASSSIVGEYEAYIRSMIDTSWNHPQDFSGYNNGALFEFDVDKSGNICNVRLVKSSGSLMFDESVQKAFTRVGLVRPTPDGKMLAGCRLTFSKKSKVL